MDLHNGISDILEQAKNLKTLLEGQMIKTKKDIDKIKNPKVREFLKTSLTLAKENKLDVTDFLNNLDKCQQK